MSGILPLLQVLADPDVYAVFNCVRKCGGETSYDLTTGICDAGTEGAWASCGEPCQAPFPPEELLRHLRRLESVDLISLVIDPNRVFARANAPRLRTIAGFFAFVDEYDPQVTPG